MGLVAFGITGDRCRRGGGFKIEESTISNQLDGGFRHGDLSSRVDGHVVAGLQRDSHRRACCLRGIDFPPVGNSWIPDMPFVAFEK